jgi:hypothetical protein
MVDRGTADSVRVGMAIVGFRGLVGRVSQVFPTSSQVVLINNKSISVSCMDRRSRVVGMLEWDRGSFFRLEYVGKEEDVVVGDTLVTSGLGMLFPKGFPIGTVFQVTEDRGGISKRVRRERGESGALKSFHRNGRRGGTFGILDELEKRERSVRRSIVGILQIIIALVVFILQVTAIRHRAGEVRPDLVISSFPRARARPVLAVIISFLSASSRISERVVSRDERAREVDPRLGVSRGGGLLPRRCSTGFIISPPVCQRHRRPDRHSFSSGRVVHSSSFSSRPLFAARRYVRAARAPDARVVRPVGILIFDESILDPRRRTLSLISSEPWRSS